MGLFSLPQGHTDGKVCPACEHLQAEVRYLRERLQTKQSMYAAIGVALPPLRPGMRSLKP